MKRYDIFDFTKLILSIMVVATHTKLFPMILFPWVRLAVPLFLIISSFLLYNKINNSPSELKYEIIRNYIKRLLKLYIFWFIVLLPITLYVRKELFYDGIVLGIFRIFLKLIFGSTFVASWYISATIIGTLIVEKLSSNNNKVVFIVFLLIYIVCCINSSYTFLYEKSIFFSFASKYIWDIQCSFPVSLIYIFLGKVLAEKRVSVSEINKKRLLLLSCILLYIEWIMVCIKTGQYNNDCYLFIMPTSLLLFLNIKDIIINIKNSKTIRQFSSFIYPLHASVARIIGKVLELLTINEIVCGVINFGITMIICIVCFYMVKKLEKKIKILKYLY